MTRSASSSLNLFLRVSAAHFLRPIVIWTDARMYMHPHVSHRKRKHIYLYIEFKHIPLRHIRTVLAPIITEIRAHQNLKTQLHPSALDLKNHKSHLPSKSDNETLVHCVCSTYGFAISQAKKACLFFCSHGKKKKNHKWCESPFARSMWSGLIIKCLYI